MSYLGIPSFLQHLDALSKFSELFAIAFLAYIITNPVHQFILFCLLTVLILALGRIPVRDYLAGLSVFLVFGFVLLVMQILLYSGPETEALLDWGPFSLRTAALRYGINLGFRVFVIGSSVLSFIMTTEPRRLIYDMVERLKIPYRFAYGFYSALRFIPIFEEEARNIMNAHAIRYPYWENAARGYEDILAVILVLQILFLLIPTIIIIVTVVSLWKRKQWTWRDAGRLLAAGRDNIAEKFHREKNKWKDF